jgi:hypothetical protein
MKQIAMTKKHPAVLNGFCSAALKKLIIPLVFFGSFIILTGCATVKIYSDPDLKNETGLRYYTLKPYLLVEYRAEKDNTVRTSVMYLPDLANPQYLEFKTGIGSNDIKLTFTNSALTSYGVISESMFSETLEAVAAMLSKSAYAAQAFTGAEVADTDESGTYFRLYEIFPGPDGTTLKEIVPGRTNN